jgi:hypothetical protein
MAELANKYYRLSMNLIKKINGLMQNKLFPAKFSAGYLPFGNVFAVEEFPHTYPQACNARTG